MAISLPVRVAPFMSYLKCKLRFRIIDRREDLKNKSPCEEALVIER